MQSVSACCGKRLMFNFHLSDPVVLVNAINAVSMNLTFRSWPLPSKPVFVEEMAFEGALAEYMSLHAVAKGLCSIFICVTLSFWSMP